MDASEQKPPADEGRRSSEGLGPLEARAWLYHDGPTPEQVPDELLGTRVLAWERHPHYRNETALYALTPEEVAAVNKLRARKEWMKRDTARCKCDHHEYCRHCWPESFRPGGVWHGLGA